MQSVQALRNFYTVNTSLNIHIINQYESKYIINKVGELTDKYKSRLEEGEIIGKGGIQIKKNHISDLAKIFVRVFERYIFGSKSRQGSFSFYTVGFEHQDAKGREIEPRIRLCFITRHNPKSIEVQLRRYYDKRAREDYDGSLKLRKNHDYTFVASKKTDVTGYKCFLPAFEQYPLADLCPFEANLIDCNSGPAKFFDVKHDTMVAEAKKNALAHQDMSPAERLYAFIDSQNATTKLDVWCAICKYHTDNGVALDGIEIKKTVEQFLITRGHMTHAEFFQQYFPVIKK